MKITEQIKVIKSLIKEKQSTEIKDLDIEKRIEISKQLFVLNETLEKLLHSIGLKTEEEKEKEREYYAR